jgi:sodium transport system permease protein
MGTIGVIVRKELRRVFKDRKMIFGLFVFPAVLVIGIYALIGQLTSSLMDDVDTHIPDVLIAGVPLEVEEVIQETAYEKMANVSYVSVEEAEVAREKVTNEEIDLIVVFSDDFYETYLNYETDGDTVPAVQLYYTTAGNYSSQARYTFEETILSPLEEMMIVGRVGSLEVLRVFDAEKVVMDEENTAAAEVLSMMMPYFITMMLFAGAMSLGVDAIAGEKERGTMAILLLTPVERYKIAWGKIISLAILSSMSACVYTASMLISLPNMMNSMAGDAMSTYTISFSQVVSLLLIMLSMVVLYVSMIGIVSVYATSLKEAQSYVSPLYIVVIIAGLLTMFQGGKEVALHMFAIPLYGNALTIQQIVMNELTLPQFLLSFGGTTLLSLILIAGITKAFNSEKVMFHA